MDAVGCGDLELVCSGKKVGGWRLAGSILGIRLPLSSGCCAQMGSWNFVINSNNYSWQPWLRPPWDSYAMTGIWSACSSQLTGIWIMGDTPLATACPHWKLKSTPEDGVEDDFRTCPLDPCERLRADTNLIRQKMRHNTLPWFSLYGTPNGQVDRWTCYSTCLYIYAEENRWLVTHELIKTTTVHHCRGL